MTLEEIMKKKNWVVLGDTVNPEKYAHRIKTGLVEKGFNVECVGKELSSIDEVEGDIDVLDMCIHPVKGLNLLKETKKEIGVVLIQPGAESEDIKAYLEEKKIEYLEGCALLGMKLWVK